VLFAGVFLFAVAIHGRRFHPQSVKLTKVRLLAESRSTLFASFQAFSQSAAFSFHHHPVRIRIMRARFPGG
jgi:hypothetical protein